MEYIGKTQQLNDDKEKLPLIVIAGPTASGKSALAVELALRLGGEIISADSMQIYKGLPIGTAQPDENEKKGIPHHLIGFLDLSESFSAAQYVKLAQECILEIRSRGRIPILAGGTGLYISSLIRNVQFEEEDEERSAALRSELTAKAEKEGWESLEAELIRLDPRAAEGFDVHNHKRLIRALELCILTGKTAAQRAEDSRSISSPYECACICLHYAEREKLYARIDLRVEKMVEAGLLKEARCLFENDAAGTARQAIGYKEFFPFFNKEKSLEEAVADVQRESRRYAKRQLTWFRREKEFYWLDVGSFERASDLIDEAEKYCKEKLTAWL